MKGIVMLLSGLVLCVVDVTDADRISRPRGMQVGSEQDDSMDETHQRYNSSEMAENMAAVGRKPMIAEPYAECPYACQNGKDFAITLQLKQQIDYEVVVNFKRKIQTVA